MKRINPVGSVFGIGLTILLFAGLGFSLWIGRGLAFSPGAVTDKSNGNQINGFSSHAAFEKQCRNCHEPLTSTLAQKCLSCHADVSQQAQSRLGVHSKIANLDQCASCHPDHKGRNFDPTLASLQLFDHSKTTFSLDWHQENYDATPMECKACHRNDNYSIIDNQTCLDCHASHEAGFGQTHVEDFGANCLGCHDGKDRMRDFDHQTTGYALVGQHLQARCTACHKTSDLKNTPQNCSDCHAEPAMHKGLFQQSCETCHTPAAWKPASLDGQAFEHLATTGFSLALHQADYSNQVITCTSCHPQDLKILALQTCIDCHSQHDPVFMTDHQAQYGSKCMVCHDGVDRLHNFEHANFFALDGRHASLQCTDCHANQVYRGTPSACSDCHKEPEIHAGVFGLQCADCHTTEAWSPATLRQHTFPLNHGLKDQGVQLACDTCHGSNYIEYTCYNCHEHQVNEITKTHLEAGIADQDIPACAKCHPDGTVTKGEKKP
jgi:hypothetical protein